MPAIPNPVVRSFVLRDSEWMIREYRSGQVDAAHLHSPAVSQGFASIQAAIDYVREQERKAV